MEKKKITVYDVEEVVSKMMKVEHYERAKEVGYPKIIMDNEQRKFDELVERYPTIVKAYEEYKMIKEKSAFEVASMALSEENDTITTDENGLEDRWSNYVYKVINKKCKKNVLGGILFDGYYLAIVYWYKYCDIKHPEFDNLVKGIVGTPEDKLLYAIFEGEKNGK